MLAEPSTCTSIKRSVGRPPKERPKKAINIRLDQDVIEKYKAGGPGWQSRIDQDLRRINKIK